MEIITHEEVARDLDVDEGGSLLVLYVINCWSSEHTAKCSNSRRLSNDSVINAENLSRKWCVPDYHCVISITEPAVLEQDHLRRESAPRSV